MTSRSQERDLMVMGGWHSASDLILQAEITLNAVEKDAAAIDKILPSGTRKKAQGLRRALLHNLPKMRILLSNAAQPDDSVDKVYQDGRAWRTEVIAWRKEEEARGLTLPMGLKEASSPFSSKDLLAQIEEILDALSKDLDLLKKCERAKSLHHRGGLLKDRLRQSEIIAEIGRLDNLPEPLRGHLLRKGQLYQALDWISLAGKELHEKDPAKCALYDLGILEMPKFSSGADVTNIRLGQTLRDPHLSLLTDWLTNERSADKGWKDWGSLWDVLLNRTIVKGWGWGWGRRKRWKNISWEVYQRKILLLASARDLQENRVPDPLKLAATDIFVEKAQLLLSKRGMTYYLSGGILAAAALAILYCVADALRHMNPVELLGLNTYVVDRFSRVPSQWEQFKPVWEAHTETAFLSVVLLKGTTVAAFFGAIAYFLISLSRALLHEATVCFNRRHSLRFGRLFVYLHSGDLSRQDLEAAFNWNANYSTAFKDIEADKITKSPMMRIIETPPETVKASAELFKNLSGKPSQDKTEPKGRPLDDPDE